MTLKPLKDLLLINPPNNLKAVMGRGKKFIKGSTPFGPLYIAAVAERAGRTVQFLDAFTLGMGVEDVVNLVDQQRPRLVGISSITADAVITVELCKRIRQQSPGTPIILGNVHPKEFPDFFLKNNLTDFICTGEGEYTVLDVLEKLEKGGSFEDVQGIYWSPSKDKIICNPDRPVISDLNSLPMPARHLAPMDRYEAPFYFHDGRRAEGLITSRGCPNRCAFCCVHGGRKPRYRNADLMAEEFDLLTNTYGYDFLSFQDSLFMGNRERILNFCDIMKRRRRVAPWNCEGHVNFVNSNLLGEMKKAGCAVVCYGIESGVQRLLDRINKKTKLEKIVETVKMTKAAGLQVYGLFMLGLPGETPEDTGQTIKFAKSLPLDFAQFSIFTPYPGSQLFNELVAEGRIDPMDWNRFSAYAFGETDPIYVPANRSPKDIKTWQRRAITQFFLRPRIIWRQIRKMKRLSDLANAGNFARTIVAGKE